MSRQALPLPSRSTSAATNSLAGPSTSSATTSLCRQGPARRLPQGRRHMLAVAELLLIKTYGILIVLIARDRAWQADSIVRSIA
jgi:hypothetical protein